MQTRKPRYGAFIIYSSNFYVTIQNARYSIVTLPLCSLGIHRQRLFYMLVVEFYFCNLRIFRCFSRQIAAEVILHAGC